MFVERHTFYNLATTHSTDQYEELEFTSDQKTKVGKLHIYSIKTIGSFPVNSSYYQQLIGLDFEINLAHTKLLFKYIS